MSTIATMFSGGGGVECGAMAAGFVPIWAIESDPDVAAVYRQNIGPHVLVADVGTVDYSTLQAPDLLHASPVCTRASQAKTGGEELPLDLAMADAVCRALRALTPRWFTLENVIPYRSFAAYKRICATLSDLGYIWHAEHCNAADFGVPQTRRRLILRASRDGLLRGLPQADRWVGWYEAIEDLIPTLPASKFAPWQLARLPQELSESALFNANESFDQHGNGYGTVARRSPNEPAVTVSIQRPAWCKAFLIGDQYGQPQGAPDRSLQVAGGDCPAFTVRANETGGSAPRAFLVGGANTSEGQAGPGVGVSEAHEPTRCVNASNSAHRRAWLDHGRVVAMTPRALARFQSFPDSYVLPERSALARKVIGNAVAPLLYRRIVESL